jgi:magnesium transporter
MEQKDVKLNGSNGHHDSLSEAKAFCAFAENGSSLKKESEDIQTLVDIWKNGSPSSICWVDYTSDDLDREAVKIAGIVGFSETLVTNLLKNKRSGYEDLGNEMGILLPAIIVTKMEVDLNPLLILIRKNLILCLHTTEVKRFFLLRKYADTFMRKLPPNMLDVDKLTLVLIRIIDENNNKNFEHLLKIEEQGDTMSEDLANPVTPRYLICQQIHAIKHALITYLGGLWAAVDVLSSVRYGDADLLTDDIRILDKITALLAEINSHIGLAEHLSEVVASGLEVVQSIYNNQLQVLNNKLALVVSYLTILGTAFLVPNTIATAMGSSAFNLTPQDKWWYITLLLVSTVVATILSWYIVKKMGIMPKNVSVD